MNSRRTHERRVARKERAPGVYEESPPEAPPTQKESAGLYVRGRFDNARVRYQGQFLSALDEHAPEVCRSLEAILPTIGAWPLPSATKRALRDWARRFHLQPSDQSDWVLHAADMTLRRWREHQSDQRFWRSGQWILTNERPRPFTFEFGGWEGFSVPWKQWAEEALTEFNRELIAYHAQCRDRSRQQGYRLVRITSSPTPTHLAWLVRYQVRGESFTAIAAGIAVARRQTPEPGEPLELRRTVAGAVKRAARLIRLRLRQPSTGGRPRKNPR